MVSTTRITFLLLWILFACLDFFGGDSDSLLNLNPSLLVFVSLVFFPFQLFAIYSLPTLAALRASVWVSTKMLAVSYAGAVAAWLVMSVSFSLFQLPGPVVCSDPCNPGVSVGASLILLAASYLAQKIALAKMAK